MPRKYQPDYAFIRRVPLWRTHLFTAIQLVALLLLWVIKSIEEISIFFPIMVVALVGVRYLLGRYMFTPDELSVLDDLQPEQRKRAQEDLELEEEEADIMRRQAAASGRRLTLTIPVDIGTNHRRASLSAAAQQDLSTASVGNTDLFRSIASQFAPANTNESLESKTTRRQQHRVHKFSSVREVGDDDDDGVLEGQRKKDGVRRVGFQ